MQEEWIAAWEAERNTCAFHGGPVGECEDDERDWFPQMSVCWPTAQLEAAKRRYASLHDKEPFTDGGGQWAEKPSLAFPFHFSDGVRFWLSPFDLNPDDDFLENRSGTDRVSNGAESDQDEHDD